MRRAISCWWLSSPLTQIHSSTTTFWKPFLPDPSVPVSVGFWRRRHLGSCWSLAPWSHQRGTMTNLSLKSLLSSHCIDQVRPDCNPFLLLKNQLQPSTSWCWELGTPIWSPAHGKARSSGRQNQENLSPRRAHGQGYPERRFRRVPFSW